MQSFKINLPNHWVLPLSIIFLLGLIALIEIPMLQYSGGLVMYPIDDAYIRLATAKNLAANGVWGVSPHGFTSASSSILYPILLAGFFKVFGAQTIIPLLINLAAAIAFIVVLQRWLQKQGLASFHQLLILVGVTYLAPLHVMVADGMEHTLQILLSLLFVLDSCGWLARGKNEDGKYPVLPWRLYVYGVLLTGIRYEGLFFIAAACLALLLRRKWIPTFLLLIPGLLPVVLFGLYSLAHGGYFIPNSILIKGIPLPLEKDVITNFFTDEIIDKLFYPYPTRGGVAANRLLILLPLVYWYYFSFLNQHKQYRSILYFLLAITILHLGFANANLGYRYEAYLVACGLVVPAVLFAKHGLRLFPKRKWGAILMGTWVIIFLFHPFFSRSWRAYQEAGYGIVHEYEYDYQTALFLHDYYNDATVVMDELGMGSWLNTGRKLDVGLGVAYMDLTESKVDGFIRLEYLDFLLTRDKPIIAMVADTKYHPWLRRNWIKVAAWSTGVRLPLGETELDIYAVDPTIAPSLRANLKTFQSKMPPGIKVQLY